MSETEVKKIDQMVWEKLSECLMLIMKKYNEHKDKLVLLASPTRHYSIDKAMDILGIGSYMIKDIKVDKYFRMDETELKNEIVNSKNNNLIILAVVPVIGTTEEGAIDPVDKVVALRTTMQREENISFFIHVDAAYGGYARSLLIPKPPEPPEPPEPGSNMLTKGEVETWVHCKVTLDDEQQQAKDVKWPNTEIYNSLNAIKNTDSIVVDPHKCGYVPYPAGAVVFKNKWVRQLIRYDPPYFSYEPNEAVRQWKGTKRNDNKGYHETPFGSTILEGSKPGAAAAACWLANKTIGLHQKGYGAILVETVRGAHELYYRLKHCDFSKMNAKIHVLTKPDFNILCFVVNRKDNKKLKPMNEDTEKVYKDFPAYPLDPLYTQEFFLSKTYFWYKTYGDSILNFLSEIEVDESPYVQGKEPVMILRSAVMNPWLSSSSQGASYCQLFVDELKIIIEKL